MIGATILTDKADLWSLARRLRLDPSEPVAIDTETTGLRVEPGGDVVRGFSVAIGTDEQWYIPLSHPHSVNADLWMARAVVNAVAHHDDVAMWNGTFDRIGLRLLLGVEFRDAQVWDGMTVDWVMNESADHRLKSVGARVFGIEAKAEKEALDALFKGTSVGECYALLRRNYLAEHDLPRLPKGEGSRLMALAREDSAASKKGWATVTAEDIGAYAAQDARLTLDLHRWQQSWLDDNPEYREGLAREFAIEGLACQMRWHGVRVDQGVAQVGMAAALERIEVLASLWPGVNLRSPQQVARLVYEDWGLPCAIKTKTGAPSTNKAALTAIGYDSRVASLLEFRKLVKQVDAFYVPLLNKLASDGRIHPSWNAHRVVTGRWSCSLPNLQQIPKEKGPLRLMLTADEGMALVTADLPSAELRIAALLSGEEAWLAVLAEDGDMHQLVADLAGISRQAGKVMNYQNLYGGGPKKLAETLGMATGKPYPLAQAKAEWRAYWKAVPRVKRMMDGLGEGWRRAGRLPIRPWPGRFRHNINMRTGFPEPGYKAMNSIIQGTIAELVKDWMLEVARLLPEGWRLVAQIHDSLVLEVPVCDIERAKVFLQVTWDTINLGRFDDLAWPLDTGVGF